MLLALGLFAQAPDDDLLSELGDSEPTLLVNASFKTNRVINLHSLENTAPGVMDFKVSHRFGFVDQGIYDLFGLDNASMRLGFEFGLTNRLAAGFGRASYQKTYDGFIKYKILRQKTGAKSFPFTVAYISTVAIKTLKPQTDNPKHFFSSNLNYTHQLLIGRKFSDKLSLQVTPILVHRNLVPTLAIDNDIFFVALAGRMKLTKWVSINAEYIPKVSGRLDEKYRNSLSLGFDIETGGHVFQLHFTNSTSMSDHSIFTETVGDWAKGQIHFGFNISRVFTLWNK
ncbi:MAG TPA: hypothetical protein ENK85_08405 [Saprospiraceae bacterium]|nr:hypothetical protein [Saprospiraceae bacterium]